MPRLGLVLSFEHHYFSYGFPHGEDSDILFSAFPFPTSWSLRHTSLKHRGGSKLRTAILGEALLFYPLQATGLCWFQQVPVLDSSHTSQFPPGNLLQPSCFLLDPFLQFCPFLYRSGGGRGDCPTVFPADFHSPYFPITSVP